MPQMADQSRLHWIPLCILPAELTQEVVTYCTVLSVSVVPANESTLVPPSREVFRATCSIHHRAPTTSDGQIAPRRTLSHGNLLMQTIAAVLPYVL